MENNQRLEPPIDSSRTPNLLVRKGASTSLERALCGFAAQQCGKAQPGSALPECDYFEFEAAPPIVSSRHSLDEEKEKAFR